MPFYNLRPNRRRMRVTAVRRFALLLVLAASGLSACGGKDGTGPNRNPAGTYLLNDVDDSAPPVTIHQGPWVDATSGVYYANYIVQVTDAVIELDADDRYSMAFVGQVNADGLQYAAHILSGGSYELDGTDIWLQPDLGAPVAGSGALNQGTLTVDLDLMSRGATNHFTFRR